MQADNDQAPRQPYQAKLNPFTGEIYGVASKANERGPKEKQGSLLLWAEERDKLARLTA